MKTDEELKAIAQAQLVGGPRAGNVFRHYKGGIYCVVARALREDTLEDVVIYHSNAKGTTWERTLANFTEEVEFDGRLVPRFTRVDH